MSSSEIMTLAVALLLAASIYVLEIWFIVVYTLKRLRNSRRKHIYWTKPAIMIHILAAIGIICFLYGFLIEPYRIEVKTHEIRTDKLKQTKFRVVQISDLHCNKKQRNEKVVVEIINRLEPDIIVFTGDAVNTPEALPVFKDTMRNLRASLAKLAVYGNWETRHWRGLDYYSQTGFKLLDAQTVELGKNGETITFSGLSCDNPQAAVGTLQKLSNERFNVFLYHYSDLIEDADCSIIDLYLCGHTHGGQVALPFYGALITMSKFGKKYESGMYSIGSTILYVNRGIGLEGFPAPQVRFLARPEITVFDIVPDS